MNDQFTIRELLRNDIIQVKDFPPAEWHFDVVRFLELHLGSPYFHGIVAGRGEALAGMANLLLFGGSAWLGNIIVAPQHRRQGIGAALTSSLVETSAQRNCGHRLLIATEMGRPVYESLGFRQTGEYVFLKPVRSVEPPGMERIRSASAGDLDAIALLDRQATAEDRRLLLQRFLQDGFVHWGGDPHDIDGFFLPAFGQGPVIASNDTAGLDLLRHKHHMLDTNACVPAGNAAAIAHLTGLGFLEDHRAPRMALGQDVAWQQDMIYARGAGYSG